MGENNSVGQCGTRGSGIIIMDTLAGDRSDYMVSRGELLQDRGFKVVHVPIYVERSEPTMFALMGDGPNQIVADFKWEKILQRIDAAVGELHDDGCSTIIGLGTGVGGNSLLQYRDGLTTNKPSSEGGRIPPLPNSRYVTSLALAYPHLEYPDIVIEAGMNVTDIGAVDKPTLLILGSEGQQIVPQTGSIDGVVEAAKQNPQLSLNVYDGAEYMFMHEGLPIGPNWHNPWYDEEASKAAWDKIMNWLVVREAIEH
jgi:dienelactone hydrolase